MQASFCCIPFPRFPISWQLVDQSKPWGQFSLGASTAAVWGWWWCEGWAATLLQGLIMMKKSKITESTEDTSSRRVPGWRWPKLAKKTILGLRWEPRLSQLYQMLRMSDEEAILPPCRSVPGYYGRSNLRRILENQRKCRRMQREQGGLL